jgi:hypothetical protein
MPTGEEFIIPDPYAGKMRRLDLNCRVDDTLTTLLTTNRCIAQYVPVGVVRRATDVLLMADGLSLFGLKHELHSD